MNTFAVIGNPVYHSKSPRIYALFAAENKIFHSYECILSPLQEFEYIAKRLFLNNYLGANITLPFKERALAICNELTERSIVSDAVNTIKKQPDGSLLGDNTDGIGLLNDLQRLNFLQKNFTILIIGAGGAVKGILPVLLSYECKIILTNRTFVRAKKIVDSYQHLGDLQAVPLAMTTKYNYDLIINATSSSIQGQNLPLPSCIITPHVRCYDLFYQAGDTIFIKWCKHFGAIQCADGLGMLVEQAAYSFLLWHNIFPSIVPVIKTMRLELL